MWLYWSRVKLIIVDFNRIKVYSNGRAMTSNSEDVYLRPLLPHVKLGIDTSILRKVLEVNKS